MGKYSSSDTIWICEVTSFDEGSVVNQVLIRPSLINLESLIDQSNEYTKTELTSRPQDGDYDVDYERRIRMGQ